MSNGYSNDAVERFTDVIAAINDDFMRRTLMNHLQFVVDSMTSSPPSAAVESLVEDLEAERRANAMLCGELEEKSALLVGYNDRQGKLEREIAALKAELSFARSSNG